DIAAERSKVVGAGVARRHTRGRALVCDQLVSRNADGRAIRIDVGMKIDETGRYELARGIEDAQCALCRDVRFESFDNAKANADVALAPQALARVEHVAALDHKIEFVIRSHGGARCTHSPGNEGERSCSREKVSARRGHALLPSVLIT